MKIRKWEIALMAGFIFALALAAPLSVQAELSSKLTRLHVVANSDSDEDQALKLKVRDAVLEASKGYSEINDELLSVMQKAAEECIKREGYNYGVTVELSEMWFDTRDYDGFSLAAGMYDAVKVKIGKGEGKNWWCVIFPPLCAAVSEKELKQTAKQAGLSGKEVSFIAKDGRVCVLGFKFVELWGRLWKKGK